MNNFIKYFLLGTLFWIIVDFTTTTAIKNPDLYYSTYMPMLLIFYIGFPLIFSLLIYRFKIGNELLFILTLVTLFIVEILLSHNALLYTFPIMLLAIPAAVSIYTFVIFVPKWIIDGEIRNNKWKIIIMSVIYILISLVTILGK